MSSSKRVAEVAQQRRADGVQRRDHGHAVGGHLLGLLRRRALPDAELRVALPDTAAASGTVASTRSCPSRRAPLRFVSVSDWLRNGTHRTTVSARRRRLGVREPLDLRLGDRRAGACAASAALPGVARAHDDGHAGAAPPHRQAEAERPGGADDRDGREHTSGWLWSPRWRLWFAPHAPRGPHRARDRWRRRHRGGHRPRLAAEGRARRDRRPRRGGRPRDRRRARRSRCRHGRHRAQPRCAPAWPRWSEALGPIDVLVNNAGTDRFAYFVKSDEELWDFVLGVNLRGVLACTHAVLGAMQERRPGAIVNVASEAGRVGSQGSGHLLGGQGGRHRLHEGDRPRGGALRRAAERRRPRADRDAAAERGARAARRDR